MRVFFMCGILLCENMCRLFYLPWFTLARKTPRHERNNLRMSLHWFLFPKPIIVHSFHNLVGYYYYIAFIEKFHQICHASVSSVCWNKKFAWKTLIYYRLIIIKICILYIFHSPLLNRLHAQTWFKSVDHFSMEILLSNMLLISNPMATK